MKNKLKWLLCFLLAICLAVGWFIEYQINNLNQQTIETQKQTISLLLKRLQSHY